MIVVSGTVTIDPAGRERALALFEAVAKATRSEAGCAVYVIAADLDHPGRFWVLEEWSSTEALDAHMFTPQVAAFVAGLAELRVLEMMVHSYRVESKKRML